MHRLSLSHSAGAEQECWATYSTQLPLGGPGQSGRAGADSHWPAGREGDPKEHKRQTNEEVSL